HENHGEDETLSPIRHFRQQGEVETGLHRRDAQQDREGEKHKFTNADGDDCLTHAHAGRATLTGELTTDDQAGDNEPETHPDRGDTDRFSPRHFGHGLEHVLLVVIPEFFVCFRFRYVAHDGLHLLTRHYVSE